MEEYLWSCAKRAYPNATLLRGWPKFKRTIPAKDPMQVVRERLEYEMNVIVPKGMGDYFLDRLGFYRLGKKQRDSHGSRKGIRCRLDCPISDRCDRYRTFAFHFFFERFINPERISYPDIDVDICMDRRGEVIDYTVQKYGKDNVAQIITFGTMKARMAIKDVGRVLSVPLRE